MAMESVLKRLEGRMGELLERYQAAQRRVAELEEEAENLRKTSAEAKAAKRRVASLEKKVDELKAARAAGADANQRLQELEAQRTALAARLEDVLNRLDEALGDE